MDIIVSLNVRAKLKKNIIVLLYIAKIFGLDETLYIAKVELVAKIFVFGRDALHHQD